MRWCRCVLPVVMAAALSGQASSEVVVREWSGHYVRGVHYDVELPSLIRVFEYHEGFVYDFECYDDVTNDPATIQAIVPGANLMGTVELKVVGHDGREFGAENVDQLLFDYESSPYPELTIKGFKIHGTLGTVPSVENHVFGIDGEFSAGSIAAPFYVFGELGANLTVTGSVQATGLLEAGRFDAPHIITVTGSLLGSIRLGHED